MEDTNYSGVSLIFFLTGFSLDITLWVKLSNFGKEIKLGENEKENRKIAADRMVEERIKGELLSGDTLIIFWVFLMALSALFITRVYLTKC